MKFSNIGKVKQTVFEEEGKRKDGSLVPIEISYSLSKATMMEVSASLQ